MTDSNKPSKQDIKHIVKILFQRLLKADRKIMFFLIFVVISSLLWLMNALSKDYITEIECPISFYSIPDNYVMVENSPSSIQLQVSGGGFSLLKYTIGSIALPYRINLQSYFSGNQKDQQTISFQYYISGKKEDIEKFINDDIKVLDVRPSAMKLKFDRLHQQKFKIEPVTQLKFAPQYRQKGALITKPDSVLVNGPKSVLDTLKNIKTKPIRDEEIKSNRQYKTKLKTPAQCNLSIQNVKIKLRTEQYTENTIRIPIRITNKPDSLNLKIFPDKINVTYLVSFNNYQIIDAEDFQAAIDYNDIKKQDGPQELQINLLFVPEEARVVRYWPQKARFIITTK